MWTPEVVVIPAKAGIYSIYILFDWRLRLCRPALRKGFAFPGCVIPADLSRGYASPVEALPQPKSRIWDALRKGEAFPQDRAAEPLTVGPP